MSNVASALSNDLYHRTATEDHYFKELREFSKRSWRIDEQEKGWTHENVWRFADGTEARVNGKGAGELAIPANPGFEYIVYNPEDPNPPARTVIVGWRLPGDGDVLPIGVGDDSGYRTSVHYVGIVHPDKRILWGNHWFDDESAFIAAVVDAHIKQKREREAPCPSCGGTRCAPVRPDDVDIPF